MQTNANPTTTSDIGGPWEGGSTVDPWDQATAWSSWMTGRPMFGGAGCPASVTITTTALPGAAGTDPED